MWFVVYKNNISSSVLCNMGIGILTANVKNYEMVSHYFVVFADD